jgi:hypothetical protein
MPSIWISKDNSKWSQLEPSPYDLEATLHERVAMTPEMLPLSGQPRLVTIGSEVPIGNNAMDVLLVESTGRLVVLEVKLAKNSEARRAVVSQALSYAAYLKGMTRDTLEKKIVRPFLGRNSADSIAGLVEASLQSGAVDRAAFNARLDRSLEEGDFRIVYVLDSAPDELVRLVGYLESITTGIDIDLVTVAAYNVGGTTILLPQRVDPGRRQRDTPDLPVTETSSSPGPEVFLRALQNSKAGGSLEAKRLTEWIELLRSRDLVRLISFVGKKYVTLLPYRLDRSGGFVSVYLEESGRLSLQFWKSVFERSASETLEKMNALLAPQSVGQGTTTYSLTEEVFTFLTEAYEHAALMR